MFVLGVLDDRHPSLAAMAGRKGCHYWAYVTLRPLIKSLQSPQLLLGLDHTLCVYVGWGRGWAGNSCSRKVPWKLFHYSLMNNALSDVE